MNSTSKDSTSLGPTLPGPSLVVLACALGLAVIGLIVLLSAAQGSASGSFAYAQKQVVWMVLALIAGASAWLFPLEHLRKMTPVIGLGALALLVLVLVPGLSAEIKGARRWFDFGPLSFQVSELAKLALVLVLADYLAKNWRRSKEFLRGFVLPCLMIGLCCGLIILQPDYGTAALCGAVGGVMVYLAGVRLRYLLPSALMALSVFGFLIWQDPIRLRRILAFMDLEGHQMDAAYQLLQGLFGFAVGGIGGVGLGNGRQQQFFLPEAHNDFILAVIGEELGLIFTLSVCLTYFAIFAAVIWKLKQAPNRYESLLVLGLVLFFVGQALINMGVVTGLLPTKGMSLPLISYGGSNLLFIAVFLGLILNSFRRWGSSPLFDEPREL